MIGIVQERKGEPMELIEKPNPNFESCNDCIYSDDSEEACILRGCIHAVVELNECYKPKQRTGKWIRNDNGTWSCDQCNSWIPDEQHYYARFCLYCGARMEDTP